MAILITLLAWFGCGGFCCGFYLIRYAATHYNKSRKAVISMSDAKRKSWTRTFVVWNTIIAALVLLMPPAIIGVFYAMRINARIAVGDAMSKELSAN